MKKRTFNVLKTISDKLEQDIVLAGPISSNSVAKAVVSTESFGDHVRVELDQSLSNLQSALEAISADVGIELTDSQVDAAAYAGVMTGDLKTAATRSLTPISISTENAITVRTASFGEMMTKHNLSVAKEAYDETENRNCTLYTIVYNMQAARQDEFGEAFYPTITISPDQAGVEIEVELVTVMDAISRDISGQFKDFARKNVIRAVANPDVLRREVTTVVPVVRPASASKFVDPTLVAPISVVHEGETVTTAPLKAGETIDLIGISQLDSLVAKGIMDQTDSLDPTLYLKNVYVTFTDGTDTDVVRFRTLELPLAGFAANPQSNYREMILNFTTTSLLINGKTTKVDGSPLVALAPVYNGTPGDTTDDYQIRLEMNVTGTVNLETGRCQVFGNSVSVHQIQDAAGNVLDLTSGTGATLAGLVNSGTIVGYDLRAARTNANRRQTGQLLNVTKFKQIYNVLLRSPITVQHPAHSDESGDVSDVRALINTTHARTSADAVDALINAAAVLGQYVDARDETDMGPEVLGVGRFYVRASYLEDNLDMALVVDSLSSKDRPADLSAAIVNKIRDMAYRLYRDSEYQAAANALAGGIAPTPTVVVGTDPVIARYLTIQGDLRTLGGEFDVKVVSTLNRKVKGKVFITFSNFDASRNSEINPLNFGNMFWAPEVVLTANISRSGGLSRETAVQPRYEFVTHLPVLGVLTVDNIPATLNKLAVNFHNV